MIDVDSQVAHGRTLWVLMMFDHGLRYLLGIYSTRERAELAKDTMVARGVNLLDIVVYEQEEDAAP
jgi:hypothetical protein